MPASNKQKMKLLYLMRILERETDPKKGLSMPQIIERLEQEGISAERKSIYRDIQALKEVGFDVQKLPTRPVEYVLVRSELGLDDVMMLVDIVQSSRFVTESKSNKLVKSLKGLVSDRERKLLAKRVHVEGRIKSQTESVFRNVDIIHEALQRRRKVRFLYYSYGTDLKRTPRHEGRNYELTPVKVIFADGNYYLAAFDDADGKIKTYRIDRMELLQVAAGAAARNDQIANYEYEDFAFRSFGMFDGKPESITLRADSSIMNVIVDRFGRQVEVLKSTDSYAEIRVSVLVSPQFFGWIAGLDGAVRIKTPKRVGAQYQEWLESLLAK